MASVQHVDLALIDITAHDVMSYRRKTRASRQADVAGSYYAQTRGRTLHGSQAYGHSVGRGSRLLVPTIPIVDASSERVDVSFDIC
jgi:hypothetical protein